jgi:predicted small metal-binding protein
MGYRQTTIRGGKTMDEGDGHQDRAAQGELVVRCDCSFEARGTEADLVPAMQKHAREVHNMEATREQVLARAQPA